MKNALKATQSLADGKLFLKGIITAPMAGYVVDTLTLCFTCDGEKAALVMDLFPPSGGGLRSICRGESDVKIDLCFKTPLPVRQLTVYLHGETITLDVTQLNAAELKG